MTHLRVPPSLGATTAALAVLLLAGCSKEPVRSYRTAKEPLPPAETADPHAGHNHQAELPPDHPPIGAGGLPMTLPDGTTLPAGHQPIGDTTMAPPAAGAPAAATAGTDSLVWAAPDHWLAKPLGPMRRGSFTPKNEHGDADCSIFVFPAATNPLLANINRWRGQIGLPNLSEAQLPAETSVLENSGLSFTVVDMLGQQGGNPTRVLGAILYRGDEAWFFKLGGPDATVAAEKSAFLDFLRTVHPATP